MKERHYNNTFWQRLLRWIKRVEVKYEQPLKKTVTWTDVKPQPITETIYYTVTAYKNGDFSIKWMESGYCEMYNIGADYVPQILYALKKQTQATEGPKVIKFVPKVVKS